MPPSVKDITQQRFGNLVALSSVGVRHAGSRRNAYWLCLCDCGQKVEVDGAFLRSGNTKSCGYCGAAGPAYPVGDLTGKRFGRMTVVAQDGEPTPRWRTPRRWKILCDCGAVKTLPVHFLVSHKSCGSCGRWTVIPTKGRLTPTRFLRYQDGQQIWSWACECGKSIEGPSNWQRQSCGCLRRPRKIRSPQLAFDTVYAEYQKGAEVRKLAWQVSEKDFENIIQQKCHYCGTEPEREIVTRTANFRCNGIDRVDNSKGYIEGNLVPCCQQCNMAKRNQTYETFNRWLGRVASFRSSETSERQQGVTI